MRLGMGCFCDESSQGRRWRRPLVQNFFVPLTAGIPFVIDRLLTDIWKRPYDVDGLTIESRLGCGRIRNSEQRLDLLIYHATLPLTPTAITDARAIGSEAAGDGLQILTESWKKLEDV